VDELRRRRDRVRLFFAGSRHPNPDVGETPTAARARALSDELGLTGVHVFFHDWVDYAERENFLTEADIGLSAHVEHVETAFSFRTRVLDYLWAGLPVVTTRGDTLAATIAREGAGIAVPPGDVVGLATALEQLLADDAARAESAAAAARLATDYRWSTVLAPLVAFCARPARSPDLLADDTARAIARGGDPYRRDGRDWKERLPGPVRTVARRARRVLGGAPEPGRAES
jgi:glycosyltransferase involved in cell wall biosynthesis